jgi:hypothetical protein
VDSDKAEPVIDSVKGIMGKQKGKVVDLKACEAEGSGEASLCFHLKMRQHLQAYEVVKQIKQLEGVRSVEWE